MEAQGAGADYGDGEHGYVGELVVGDGGVEEDLKGLLRVDADGGGEEQEEHEGAGEGDGVGGGAEAGVEAGEPGGDEGVPAGGHGEASDSGEDVAGGSEEAQLQEGDGGYGDDVSDAVVAEGEAEGLGDGSDVVDVAGAGVGEDGAGAEDEHGADDGGGYPDGAADGGGGGVALAGEDGDVLDSGEGSDEHLAEEGERDEGAGWECDGERLVVDGLMVRDGLVLKDRPERKQDEGGEDGEDGDAAYVMDPLA